MVINGNRFAEVQRRAEKRSLPNPFGDLGGGASPPIGWGDAAAACRMASVV